MKIVSFGQVVDLEAGGQFAHQFTIELPNRARVAIQTDEATVQRLIEIATGMQQMRMPGSNGEPPGTRWVTPSGHSAQVDERIVSGLVYIQGEQAGEEPEGEIFGGDYDPGEEHVEEQALPTEPVLGTISEERVATFTQPPGGLGQAPQIVRPPMAAPRPKPQPRVDADGFLIPPRARTVPKDEMGYPVVASKRQPPSRFDDGGDDGTQI